MAPQLANEVTSIVGVTMNKIALRIRVRVDDWKAERVIIASNDAYSMNTIIFYHLPCYWR